MKPDFQTWYNALNKPTGTPDASVIGTIWSILYPIIIGVNIYVTVQYFNKHLPLRVAAIVWLNLLLNLSFTPVQFGLRNLFGAAVIIILIWITTLLSILALWSHSKVVVLSYIPYFIWVSIASVLQLQLTWMNR
jgi:translocator protein